MRSEILLNENWRFHKGDIQVGRPADKGPVYIQSKVERKKIGPAAYHYHDKPDEFNSTGEIKSEGWVFCQLPHDYLFAAFTLLIAFAVIHKTGEAPDRSSMKQIFGLILIMAVCLFVNSYFKTLASEYLPAVLLYPLNQGCALILSAVMAAVLFKEKLTAKAIIGITTAFAGLLIINLL